MKIIRIKKDAAIRIELLIYIFTLFILILNIWAFLLIQKEYYSYIFTNLFE
jgi:hypothetical protein